MKALVCEGGGFKTAFTAGILDAWLCAQYHPFDIFIGVSGGAVIMSSYISKQYKRGWELVSQLQADSSLTSFSRFLKGGYFLELDLIEHIWDRIPPFDVQAAQKMLDQHIIEFSCTEFDTGAPVFIRPPAQEWKTYLRATSTLPIVSQCPILLKHKKLVDGAFAAPVPVQRAIDLGATEIVVIRVQKGKFKESRRNKLMSNYLLKNNYPALNELMQKEAQIYAEVRNLIEHPPQGISIHNIEPDTEILSGILSTKPKHMLQDYRAGLEKGLDFLNH